MIYHRDWKEKYEAEYWNAVVVGFGIDRLYFAQHLSVNLFLGRSTCAFKALFFQQTF